MKGVISLSIGSLLLLSACTTRPLSSNSSSDFTQKQECQKYLNGVQKKLEEMEHSNSFSSSMTHFDKLFYSKKANSCLYKWMKEHWIKDKHIDDTFYLTDALTGEHIVVIGAVWGKPEVQDYYERERKFEQEVKPYEE